MEALRSPFFEIHPRSIAVIQCVASIRSGYQTVTMKGVMTLGLQIVGLLNVEHTSSKGTDDEAQYHTYNLEDGECH